VAGKVRLLDIRKDLERIFVDRGDESLQEHLLPWPNLVEDLFDVGVDSIVRRVDP
jgi:hypothetical protein